MFSATDLSCSRGGRCLFEGISFELQGGAWLRIQGANGSGKTTLIRTLVGLSPADCGRVSWRGADIREQAHDYRRAMAYVGHPSALKDDLTPTENLRLALALDGFEVDASTALSALQRVGLADNEYPPTRYLSAGQKRRVLLARLLLRDASLWVLDEPFSALDTAAIEQFGGLLQEHLDGGRVAVITSHQPVPLPAGQELTL